MSEKLLEAEKAQVHGELLEFCSKSIKQYLDKVEQDCNSNKKRFRETINIWEFIESMESFCVDNIGEYD